MIPNNAQMQFFKEPSFEQGHTTPRVCDLQWLSKITRRGFSLHVGQKTSSWQQHTKISDSYSKGFGTNPDRLTLASSIHYHQPLEISDINVRQPQHMQRIKSVDYEGKQNRVLALEAGRNPICMPLICTGCQQLHAMHLGCKTYSPWEQTEFALLHSIPASQYVNTIQKLHWPKVNNLRSPWVLKGSVDGFHNKLT